MVNGLEELTKQIELRDAENRKIVQAYNNFEFDRREPMYAALEKRLPSLRYIIDEARKKKNPIESIAETRQGAAQIDLVLMLLPMAGTSGPEAEKMMEKLRSAKGVIENYCSLRENYLLGVAKEAKKLAAGNSISPIEVVTNLSHLDQVCRLVFPQRKDAEAYSDATFYVSKELVVMGRTMLKLTEQDSELKKLPTEHAMGQYGLATKAFEAKEFDRIYNLQFSPRTD